MSTIMRIALVFVMLIAATAAQAQTGMPKAKSVLSSEITSCFPDQTTGAITSGGAAQLLAGFPRFLAADLPGSIRRSVPTTQSKRRTTGSF